MTVEHGTPARGPRSAHGGRLPLSEQVLRSQVQAQLFGSGDPVAIGRFAVVRKIGAGGMGTVFVARDAALDRLVAVKLVRPTGGADARHRVRVLREAKALAALAHPNVVTVFEVGTHEDSVYIAMEYVAGPTLRAWRDQRPRSAGQIVAKYVAAGEGLAAAHRRGIVHRDFKPDNVLLDTEQERPRVADFGLAHTDDVPAGSQDAETPAWAAPKAKDEASTVRPISAGSGTTTASAGGTPGYMAPEQLRGEASRAASDQYSFCVSLYEALHGYRPGDDADAATDRGAVPRRVRAALARGLQPRAEDRWPNIDALLAALRPRSRRPLGWFVAALVASGGAAAWGSRQPTCHLDAVTTWGEAKAKVATAFQRASADPARGATVGYVAPTWPAVSRALDRYDEDWAAQSLAACRFAPARSSAWQARALDCLAQRRSGFEALVARLVAGEPPALADALTESVSLPAVQSCNADGQLARWRVPADAGPGASGAPMRDALQRASEVMARESPTPDVGDRSAWLTSGAQAAERARQEAVAAGDLAMQSRALYLLSQLAHRQGDLGAAETHAQAAASLAEQGSDPRARIRAVAWLAYLVGQDRKRLREARQLAAQGMAALATVQDEPMLRAQLLNNLANVAARARPPDFAAALADHREAVALLVATAGEDHPDTIRARLNLGATLNRAGQSAEALETLAAATASAQRGWGPESPRYAQAARTLGLALLHANDLVQAQARLVEALRIDERAFGSEHSDVASDRFNLALVLRKRGRPTEALASLRLGQATFERQHGPEHPELIPWLVLHGRLALDLGEHDDAQAVLRRALSLCETDGAHPREFAKIRVLLARARRDADPVDAANIAAQAREFYARSEEHAPQLAAVDALLQDLREPPR